jgi:hypothetical protein
MSNGLGQTGGAGPVWRDESIDHDKWLNGSFKDRKIMHSEMGIMGSTDPTPLDSSQLGRGKRRAARATVDYREVEDDEDDMEVVSQSTKKQRLQVSSKQRLRVSEVQRFTNQMSRPRLEQLVVDLYRSSAEFRAEFNDQINKSGFMQKRVQAQFLPINGDPRLGYFGTLPNESMFDRWCFSHSQGANCGSHPSHTRLPAVQGS